MLPLESAHRAAVALAMCSSGMVRGQSRQQEPHMSSPEVVKARLLIRPSDPVPVGTGLLARALQGLHLLLARSVHGYAPIQTEVRIDDLHGEQFYVCSQARAPIDVVLPAGTYHVSVRLGAFQHRYTVTLNHGATFDLRLPLATDRR